MIANEFGICNNSKITQLRRSFARTDEGQLSVLPDVVGEPDRRKVGAASLISDLRLPLAVAPTKQLKIAKVKITSALGVAE